MIVFFNAVVDNIWLEISINYGYLTLKIVLPNYHSQIAIEWAILKIFLVS